MTHVCCCFARVLPRTTVITIHKRNVKPNTTRNIKLKKKFVYLLFAERMMNKRLLSI